MEFNSSLPIHSQISENIRRRIASGGIKPGDRMKPVRELALEWGVNPNTMQRALAALESEGLLYAERTSGRFVTSDQEAIRRTREHLLREEVGRFTGAVTSLGLDIRDAIRILEES